MKPLKYHEKNRHATWLELFFDLIFVVAIGKVTHTLGHVQQGHFEQEQLWTFFLLFVPLWWVWSSHTIYSNRNDSNMSGHALIYSHLFLFMGLALLANLIRHAILNDIAILDFQIMSFIGMTLFFLGKQYGYFIAVPKIRKYIVQNTLIVLALGGLVILLPRVDYILCGLTATMICYVFLNFRYR